MKITGRIIVLVAISLLGFGGVAFSQGSDDMGDGNSGGSSQDPGYSCRIEKIRIEHHDVGPWFYDTDGYGVMWNVPMQHEKTATLKLDGAEIDTQIIKRTNPNHSIVNGDVEKWDHGAWDTTLTFSVEFESDFDQVALRIPDDGAATVAIRPIKENEIDKNGIFRDAVTGISYVNSTVSPLTLKIYYRTWTPHPLYGPIVGGVSDQLVSTKVVQANSAGYDLLWLPSPWNDDGDEPDLVDAAGDTVATAGRGDY